MLQYIDALTVCNISLFIMDEPCHGYYVHGQSPHGFADTDRKELNTNLAKEEVWYFVFIRSGNYVPILKKRTFYVSMTCCRKEDWLGLNTNLSSFILQSLFETLLTKCMELL